MITDVAICWSLRTPVHPAFFGGAAGSADVTHRVLDAPLVGVPPVREGDDRDDDQRDGGSHAVDDPALATVARLLLSTLLGGPLLALVTAAFGPHAWQANRAGCP